ncbi:retention module-containing protein, partial [Enterobacter sp. CC120223-11]|uniref:retention module-containing protein n=1 Tax=Enterobacter sp. CC120223-11 TaxID=1378073 RepID=UPI000BC98338
MSTVMGTIKAVIGQVWIVGANGTQRQAIEGEVLLRGEEVVTGQGAVTLTLPDGKNLDLGRASTWSGNSAESSTQDLAAAQQAIAQGGDPTQILEATAAGTPTAITEDAGDGGGGHSSVVLDLTGQILDPTAGYPTSGIDAAFTGPLEEQTLIYTAADPGSDANLPPVAPPVTPPVPPVTPPVNPPEPPVTPPEPPVKPPLPQASITLDAIATDNILNMKEAAEPTTLVSGTTGHDVKPGDTVTVTVNGNEYSTVVGEEGRWSVEVNTNDLLASGDVEANVTTRDEHGNEATANAQGSVGQATLSVKITIDPIGGDGYLNNAELKEESTTLSGRVSEGTPEGTEITLTMDGRPIGTATVNHDGTWSTTVETSLIKDGGKVQAEISLSDKYGNEVDAKAEAKVEPRPLSVEITIDTIGGDGYLNNAELSEKLTAISGTV